MKIEYERKYLVSSEAWRDEIETESHLAQGYLARTPLSAVRVRVAGDAAWLTVKGEMVGHGRPEFEYSIPVAEGREMLSTLAETSLTKVRFTLARRPFAWTVDVFNGSSEGLVLLEIEDREPLPDLELPSWVGEEVTYDPRYQNSYLSDHPFKEWSTSA